MHLTRQETPTQIPIRRKGTKYVARAKTDTYNSVAAVIALRDMLHLANTAKEVKEMIKEKSLKINGRIVTDLRESIKLFNILEAGKSYRLTLSNTGKFVFEHAKDKERLCKVTKRTLLRGKKIQINLHDGSNVLNSDDVKVGDSLYLSFKGEVKKHVKLEKGKSAFIISGKYKGFNGKITEINLKEVVLNLENKEAPVTLHQSQVVVL